MPRVYGSIGVEPFFHCPVVGGHKDGDACFACLFNHSAHLPVDGLDGADHGGFVLDVTDDVHVGKVRQNEIVAVRSDLPDSRVGHFRDGHLRCLIEEGHVLSSGHNDAVLAGEGFLPFAIEKITHVKGLFGLGDLHLTDAAS